MKNINNQPKYKPFNLLEHHNRRSLNDDFLYRIQKQGELITKMLSAKNSPQELKNAISIIELNNFNDDFLEIISLLENIHVTQNNILLKIKKSEEFLKRIDPQDLISKIKNFYRIAWNYDENFTMRSWYPTWNSRPAFFPNTFLLNINLSYSEKKIKLRKYLRRTSIF